MRRRTIHRLGDLVWLWPALATLAVTGFGADRAELWRDELATWSAATRSAPELLRLAVTIDGVSAPYYLFMHGWIALVGDAVGALRAPSVLAMTGASALTAVLGARLFGGRAGLLAGLLFAALPSTSRYAQEARPYAIATLLGVAATLLLVRALERPSWRRWLAYALAVTALGLTNLLALSLLAGHAGGLLIGGRPGLRRHAPGWAVAALAAIVALAPLFVLGLRQRGTQLSWVALATPRALPDLPGGLLGAPAVGGAVLALAALGWALQGRRAHLLALSALVPAALLFVAGLALRIFVPRYLIFTVPLICLLAAAALATVRLRAALAVVLTVGLLGTPAQAGLRRTHEWPRSAPREYRSAAEIIGAQQRPGDGIVYGSRRDWAFLDIAVAYHLRGDRPRDVLLARSATERGSLWATECTQPAQCLAGVDRVWVLTVGQPGDPLQPMPPRKAAALREEFAVRQVWRVRGLTVALLGRR
ncbi:glycosyltransferase family 39 protein [Micromonospora pattaloongensis]|uniref:glycosyltransferase family 39 protein n=1 Tax=Micromonospora pattaloongensis TaxID=405436 RepID=UPI000B8740F2|nr:glycosyltransferase family 39 protein [Micromonospora pattaloongensis]